MTFSAIVFAIAASSPTVPAVTAMFAEQDAKLAVASLAQGKDAEAIRTLENELAANPDDPAVLINLGVAYAHRGDEAKARELFKAAMSSDEVTDLDTADGSTMDSRRTARRALAMLDRGEFQPVVRTADALTLRD